MNLRVQGCKLTLYGTSQLGRWLWKITSPTRILLAQTYKANYISDQSLLIFRSSNFHFSFHFLFLFACSYVLACSLRSSFFCLLSPLIGGGSLTILETLGKTIHASCMSCMDVCLARFSHSRVLPCILHSTCMSHARTVHPPLQDGWTDGCKNHAMHLAFCMYVTCKDSPPSIARWMDEWMQESCHASCILHVCPMQGQSIYP